MPVTKRRPIGHWRDPSTGEILEVYDPNLPHGEREEEERRLLDEIERKRQSDPELRLKRLRERKGRVEEERKRRASPEFQEREVEPRRKKLREIQQQYEHEIVRAVFGRLGALEGSGNVDVSTALDELKEKADALAAEYVKVKTELYKVEGALVPQPMPGLPAKPVGCDVTVQALQWINHLALQGWHCYTGTRKSPPVYVKPVV